MFNFFKKEDKSHDYQLQEIVVCKKKDCQFWITFKTVVDRMKPEMVTGIVLWEKRKERANFIAGPLPCTFCAHFEGHDFYKRQG